MTTKSIIKKLHDAIFAQESQDVINGCREVLIENITEAYKEPLFYSLPIDQITSIIKEVDFSNEDEVKEPFLILRTVISKTSEYHGKESIQLLNDIKVDKLPSLQIDDIMSLISNFSTSELLRKLYELYVEEQSSISPDIEYTVNKQNEEINKLKEENNELRNRITKCVESNQFTTITSKPTNFEEDVFEACLEDLIDSVKYHYEFLHSDIEERRVIELSSYGTCYGATTLHLSSGYGQLSIVQYLLEYQKVNKEITTKTGLTALHIACIQGQLQIVRYLCEIAKVNTEATDKDGRTALHIA